MIEIKIVLLYLPSGELRYPPLSLAVLSARLKKEGHKPIVMDLNIDYYHKHRIWFWLLKKTCHPDLVSLIARLALLNPAYDLWGFPKKYYDSQIKKILATRAEYVGFSLNISNIITSVALARRLKKIKPNIKIIFGGYACFKENLRRYLLNSGCVDHIVVGEGEEAICAILKGINYRKKTLPLVNLEEEPIPDFSVFDLDRYSDSSQRMLPYMSTRSCRNFCAFCTDRLIWKKYRYKSAKKIFRDIIKLKEKYNAKSIDFTDAIVMGNLKTVDEFCNLIIKNKVDLEWKGCLSLREFDDSVFRNMKKSGCTFLFLGVESGSQNILNKMKKGTKIETITKIIRSLNKNEITLATSFIVGYPTEIWKDYFKTMKFVFDNRKYLNYIVVNILSIQPGTSLYCSPERFGIKNKDNSIFWYCKGSNILIRSIRKIILDLCVKLFQLKSKKRVGFV